MKRAATARNAAQPRATDDDATLRIGDTIYFPASAVASAVGVSRQTLWRWRSDGKVPRGTRYRDGQVVFTEKEFAEIRQFADRLEPVAIPPSAAMAGES
jgi:predicted DNA-binding transcriptional regulator AlpA